MNGTISLNRPVYKDLKPITSLLNRRKSLRKKYGKKTVQDCWRKNEKAGL